MKKSSSKVDWQEYLYKEEPTYQELLQIPSICAVSHSSNLKRYIDNGWDVDSLLKNIPYNVEEMMNENNWLNPLQTKQFELNYYNNLPIFEPHYLGQYNDGLNIFSEETGVHRMMIRIIPFTRILKLANSINEKFNNEFDAEFISTGRNSGFMSYKPRPFKYNLLLGHECHFSRGVVNAIFEIKDLEYHNVEEVFCAARFENILLHYYPYLYKKLEIRGNEYLLDGAQVAIREKIGSAEIDNELPEEYGDYFELVRITSPVDVKGYRIFGRNELFNAPFCCFRTDWKRKPFFRRRSTLFELLGLGSSLRKLEQQLEIAQKKTHEANQARRQLELEIKKKDEFLSRTAHELRTPLNGVTGLVDSVLAENTGILDPESAERLRTASVSSWRLSRLINDILDYSKMKDDSISLQISEVDVFRATESVVKNIEILVSSDDVSISLCFPPGLPHAKADEIRLNQILYNLLGNAVKFTSRGFISIKGSIEGEMLRITVRDTGRGIPGEKLEDIFLPYDQGAEDTASRYGGTGLGLYVTKMLIELHGGEISVDSVEGEWAEFSFTLPAAEKSDEQVQVLARAEPAGKAAPSETQGIVMTDKGTPRILVIDDEAVNLKVIDTFLQSGQFDIYTASNSEYFDDWLDNDVLPDLIVLDIYMPDRSGLELCREVRKNFLPHELPVLMLTASSSREDLIRSFESGANDYLTKPVSRDELIARVETQLKLKQVVAEIRYTGRKMNEIDGIFNLGVLASAFLLDNSLFEEKADDFIIKAQEYFSPISELNQSVLSEVRSHRKETVREFLMETRGRLRDSVAELHGEDDIDELTSNIFELISGLILAKSPEGGELNREYFAQNNQFGLSPKEIQVAVYVYKGYTNKEIAGLMNIRLNTVKQHVYKIFNKVGVENRAHLVYKLLR